MWHVRLQTGRRYACRYNVRQVRNDLYLSHCLFPELSTEMDKVSIVRTFKSHEGFTFGVNTTPAQGVL